MNRLTLSLCALVFLSLPIYPQHTNAPNTDALSVRATVTNYIEGYYTGDAHRMEQTLHPHYLKHIVHGTIPMREKTGEQMIAEIRATGPADLPAAQKTEQVTVLDMAGDMASAKLVTAGWTDYMTLSKVNGDWKILSVVQQID